MAHIDEEKLKQMGLDTKAGNFLLYDQNWVPFFEWMVEHTTSDNILTDDELNEINILRDQNAILSQCELDEKLMDLNQCYPGILISTDKDMKYVEEKLDMVTSLEADYRDYYREAVALNDHLGEELAYHERQTTEQREHEKRILRVCLEEASFVEAGHERKMKIFEEMRYHINNKNASVPVFMTQMPLENFNDTTDLFLKQVDMFVAKHFAGADTPLTSARIRGQIDDLKTKLADVEEQCFTTKIEVAGRANIIDQLRLKTVCPMTRTELEVRVNELRCLNSETDARFDALELENQLLLKSAIQAECDLLLQNGHEAKKTKALQRFDLLQGLKNTVANVLTYSELLWIFMRIDLDKLNGYMKMIQSYVAGEFGCAPDHSALKVLSRLNIKNHIEKFEADVLDLQKQYLTDNFFVSRNIFEITEEIHRTINCLYDSIADGRYLENFFNEYHKMAKWDDSLTKFVMDGAVSVPYVKRSELVLLETKKQELKKSLDSKIRRMIQVFEKNYVHRWRQDELWAAKQMLWVWFVMDKKRAQLALQELTKLARATPAYAKFNPIFDLGRYN